MTLVKEEVELRIHLKHNKSITMNSIDGALKRQTTGNDAQQNAPMEDLLNTNDHIDTKAHKHLGVTATIEGAKMRRKSARTHPL